MKLHLGRNALSRRMFITQSLLRKYRPNNYLDVSVGSGSFIELALRSGVKDVAGVDILLPYLKNIKNKFGNQVLAVQADAHSLPVKSNSFDYVSCLNLIEHLDRYEECIEGVLKATKNIAVFSTDCRSLSTRLNYFPFGEHTAGHLHIFNHFQLRRYLAERAKLERVFLYTLLPYVILPRLMNLLSRKNTWGLKKKRKFPAGPSFEFPAYRKVPSTSRKNLKLLARRMRLLLKMFRHRLLNCFEDERIWKGYILKQDTILAPMYVLRKRSAKIFLSAT